MPERQAQRAYIPPRESGEGGPHEVRWEGRLTRRFAFVASDSSRPAPLPPPCSAGWSPFPAIAGQDASVHRPRARLRLRATRSQSREARNGSKGSGEAVVASLALLALSVSQKKEYGTPEDAGPSPPHLVGAALPPPRPSAREGRGGGSSPSGVPPRLFPRGVVVPWCDPGQASWRLCQCGGYDRRLDLHFQRRTSHAGRNAGGHDARTAREQVASLPAGSASRPAAAICLRDAVLHRAR